MIQFARTSAQYLTRPGSDAVLDITGAITIMAWIRLTTLPSVNGEEGVIFGKILDSSHDIGYDLEVRNADDCLRMRRSTNGTTAINCVGVTPLVVGRRYHVGAIWDTSAMRVMVNGAVDGTVATTGATFSSTQAFKIGIRGDLAKAFNGLITDVRIYNRALSPDAVAAVYYGKGHDGIVTGGVGRWRMDDNAPGVIASGAVVNDEWQNHLNMTAFNSPTWQEDFLAFRRRA